MIYPFLCPDSGIGIAATMRITVITASLNCAGTIEDTITSILSQTHNDYEHLIIDGGSTDGMLDIIKRHSHGKMKVVSEPDDGIFDAMNKGIKMATGEVIGFINADDVLADETVLAQVSSAFKDPDVDGCYGDLIIVRRNNPGKIVRYWKSRPFSDGLFQRGWHPPHPAFFARKELYDRFGGFDTEFKIAADADLLIRLFLVHNIRTAYIPRLLVRMRNGGNSTGTLANIFKGNIEICRSFKKNKIKYSPFKYFTSKIFVIAKQFLTRPKEHLLPRTDPVLRRINR